MSTAVALSLLSSSAMSEYGTGKDVACGIADGRNSVIHLGESQYSHGGVEGGT